MITVTVVNTTVTIITINRIMVITTVIAIMMNMMVITIVTITVMRWPRKSTRPSNMAPDSSKMVQRRAKDGLENTLRYPKIARYSQSDRDGTRWPKDGPKMAKR